MTSGNPEKAKEDASVKEVRKAIAAGRQPVIPLSKDTKVVIQTNNQNEAEFLTRLMLRHVGLDSEQNIELWLHAMSIYGLLFGNKDERAGTKIIKELRKTANTIERWWTK